MNELAAVVVAYLTSGQGTVDIRLSVLSDLLARGRHYFLGRNDAAFAEMVSAYLEDNPQGLCSEGIARFCEATGIDRPRRTRTLMLKLQLTTTATDDEGEDLSRTVANLIPGNVDGFEVDDAHVYEWYF